MCLRVWKREDVYNKRLLKKMVRDDFFLEMSQWHVSVEGDHHV